MVLILSSVVDFCDSSYLKSVTRKLFLIAVHQQILILLQIGEGKGPKNKVPIFFYGTHQT